MRVLKGKWLLATNTDNLEDVLVNLDYIRGVTEERAAKTITLWGAKGSSWEISGNLKGLLRELLNE